MTIINTVMAFVLATGIFGIGLSIYALWILIIKEHLTGWFTGKILKGNQ